jgi:hypothetical protein
MLHHGLNTIVPRALEPNVRDSRAQGLTGPMLAVCRMRLRMRMMREKMPRGFTFVIQPVM